MTHTSIAGYLARCRAAVRNRLPFPAPETVPELKAALLKYPRQAAPYRPSDDDLRGMGLPTHWLRPWDSTSRDRLLSSLRFDPDFCRELQALLTSQEG
jgi:hypothetical protein